MGSAQTIRCSIWTLPFDKIGFFQFNTASTGIVAHCHFFSSRTEEMPEVIALDYVLIALHFSAKLCVFAFQIRCAELAANGFVFRKFLLQTGDLCLEFCNQPVCSVQSLLQLGFLFLGRMKRPLAYITASWSNSQYENAENAAAYCRQVYDAGYSPICPVLFLPTFLKDEIPQEHKDGLDMARDYLRRSHVLVVCGHGIDETVKNDIATAERLRITATTLDGILTVKGQGRGKGGARHA